MTPLFSNFSAPGISNFLRPAPVAIKTAFAVNSLPDFVLAVKPPSCLAVSPPTDVSDSTRSCRASVTMSPLTASRCVENNFARSAPLTFGEPIQFSMPSETTDCPPISSVMSKVFKRLRAAYTPAATPAGPPPIMTRSYIVTLYHFPFLCLRRNAGIAPQVSSSSGADGVSSRLCGVAVTIGSSFALSTSTPFSFLPSDFSSRFKIS